MRKILLIFFTIALVATFTAFNTGNLSEKTGNKVASIDSYFEWDVYVGQYTVKAGDSLWKISQKFNTNVDTLQNINLREPGDYILYIGEKLKVPAYLAGRYKDGQVQQPDNQNQTIAIEILELVNQERARVGAPALTLDEELSRVAQEKARDMAENGYFSHNSPTYGSPFDMIRSYGINYTRAGENIAKGHRSAEEVMEGWMNSPGHKNNILNENYTRIGVGHQDNHWVQMFIKR